MAQVACPFTYIASVPDIHFPGVGLHPHGGQAEAGDLSGHADTLLLRLIGQREALSEVEVRHGALKMRLGIEKALMLRVACHVATRGQHRRTLPPQQEPSRGSLYASTKTQYLKPSVFRQGHNASTQTGMFCHEPSPVALSFQQGRTSYIRSYISPLRGSSCSKVGGRWLAWHVRSIQKCASSRC